MRRSSNIQGLDRDYFHSRTQAVDYLTGRGWVASVNDHFHFRHPAFSGSRRVLKAKHNQWFISIVT